MDLNWEEEFSPVSKADENVANQAAITAVSQRKNETVSVATGVEVDTFTVEITGQYDISTNDTVTESHNINGAQVLPPKVQNILNHELEPGERVLYAKVPRYSHECRDKSLCVLLLGLPMAAMSIFSILLILPSIFLIVGVVGVYFTAFFILNYREFYVITNYRFITINGNKIHSLDPKDLSDIFIRGDRVVYFQEWLTTAPGGNRLRRRELAFPLEQDGSNMIAMLNDLKNNERSRNPEFDDPQASSLLNVNQIVPPHIEAVINSDLQAGERVFLALMRKHSIFQSIFQNPVGASLFLTCLRNLVLVCVSWKRPMLFIILIIDLPVILFFIQDFRRAQETVYVITDRRSVRICCDSWFFRSPLSAYTFPPFDSSDVFRRNYSNGTGDVIFSYKMVKDCCTNVFTRHEDGFYGIQNSKEVEKTLKALGRKMSAPRLVSAE